MKVLLLALALVFPTHGEAAKVRATWYGSTTGKSGFYCYQNYKYTCPPYMTGDRYMYAAVPGYKFKGSYKAEVCYNGGCIRVTVRDCLCTRVGDGFIDLSPIAFMALAGKLKKGEIWVTVKPIN